MDFEIHQLDLRYQPLRRRNARKERNLLASLLESGQLTPVVVVPTDGRAVLLDGYKRVRALKQLGRDTVHAVGWSMPQSEALLLERLMRNAEADTAIEQGWLIRELCDGCGLSLSELAKRFDKSTSWASRRLQLVSELPESIQELVRAGRLQAHAAMKHLVPLARANRDEAEAVARVCGARQFSVREVAALCTAWRSGTEATRELLLQNPELILRAQDEALKAKHELSPQMQLLGDCAAMGGIARRAARLLRDADRAALALPALHRAADVAQVETELFFSLCRKEPLHAGSEHQNRHS